MVQQDFMTEKEFELLKTLINKEFGILIKGDKRLTLHTKISHRLGILGLESYTDYYDFLNSDLSKDELFILASHITNKETYFFRERVQLDVFPEILKEIKKEKQKRGQNKVKVLSLACSSGEEPYTLNILIQECGLFLWDWDIKIIGIDIDKAALEKAKRACYTQHSFRMEGDSDGTNKNFIKKHFAVEGGKYALKRLYAANVEFKHGNLLDANTYDGIDDADVIFCRNVLIYFDDAAIRKISENLYKCLLDSGYLFIGSSESLIQRTELFTPEYFNGIIVYRKYVKN